jgi:hypothetical protein
VPLGLTFGQPHTHQPALRRRDAVSTQPQLAVQVPCDRVRVDDLREAALLPDELLELGLRQVARAAAESARPLLLGKAGGDLGGDRVTLVALPAAGAGMR